MNCKQIYCFIYLCFYAVKFVVNSFRQMWECITYKNVIYNICFFVAYHSCVASTLMLFFLKCMRVQMMYVFVPKVQMELALQFALSYISLCL